MAAVLAGAWAYSCALTVWAQASIWGSGVSRRSPPLESNLTCRSQANAAPGQAFFHVLDDVAGPAAVGHEGDDGLAGKIVLMQKGPDGGGHGVPPGRRADGDHVIVGDMDAHRLQLRLIALLHLALALLYDVVIAAGIGHGGVDPQKVAARGALKRFGDALRIAVGPRIIDDQKFFHFLTSCTHASSAAFAPSTLLPWMARPLVTSAPGAAF